MRDQDYKRKPSGSVSFVLSLLTLADPLLKQLAAGRQRTRPESYFHSTCGPTKAICGAGAASPSVPFFFYNRTIQFSLLE